MPHVVVSLKLNFCGHRVWSFCGKGSHWIRAIELGSQKLKKSIGFSAGIFSVTQFYVFMVDAAVINFKSLDLSPR